MFSRIIYTRATLVIINDHETFSKLLHRTSQIYSCFLTIHSPSSVDVEHVLWQGLRLFSLLDKRCQPALPRLLVNVMSISCTKVGFKQVNEVFWGKRSSNVIKAFHLNVPRSFEKDCQMKM